MVMTEERRRRLTAALVQARRTGNVMMELWLLAEVEAALGERARGYIEGLLDESDKLEGAR